MANINLNVNAIYALLDNMIISQQTFANPIGGLSSDIVDGNRVDGTLYGDQKRYTSVDMIHPVDWTNDSEATNLLALKRNKRVATENIVLDVFKMFKLTTDAILTKQAFMNEGNFANFNSVQISMIRDGKKAYDVTTFNTYLGTHGTQNRQITVAAGANEALVISNGVADILDEMSELETTFNNNGYIRAYGAEDVDIIFNKKYINSWKYQDLPIVFHKDGILANHKKMNQKYFGFALTTTNYSTYSASTPTKAKPIDSDTGVYKRFTDADRVKIRASESGSATIGVATVEWYAGDELPDGLLVYSGGAVVVPCYIEDPSIVGIIIGKGAIPFMSASENSTAFWNPQSLTTTNFLIWGHNTLKPLGEKPYVVIRKA